MGTMTEAETSMLLSTSTTTELLNLAPLVCELGNLSGRRAQEPVAARWGDGVGRWMGGVDVVGWAELDPHDDFAPTTLQTSTDAHQHKTFSEQLQPANGNLHAAMYSYQCRSM